MYDLLLADCTTRINELRDNVARLDPIMNGLLNQVITSSDEAFYTTFGVGKTLDGVEDVVAMLELNQLRGITLGLEYDTATGLNFVQTCHEPSLLGNLKNTDITELLELNEASARNSLVLQANEDAGECQQQANLDYFAVEARIDKLRDNFIDRLTNRGCV